MGFIEKLRPLVRLLPANWRETLRGAYYKQQIRAGHFVSPEPDFDHCASLINKGDWVIDVGANVGHYTLKFSVLVGQEGRVIAFEPVPNTFKHLASNAMAARFSNITLFNVAASDQSRHVNIELPVSPSGNLNYYTASITNNGGDTSAIALSIDSLSLPNPITLVKIDAEGHDTAVLAGMTETIKKCRPAIIVESDDEEIDKLLRSLDYEWTQLPGSPNRIYEYAGQSRDAAVSPRLRDTSPS